MGLDMYLNTRRSVYLKKDKRTIDLDNIGRNPDDIDFDEFGCSNRVEISETVAYWRKANAIHNWFVTNVQEGNDDCEDHYVSEKKFEKLLGICNEILSKIDGLVFRINPKTKEFYDAENKKAEENFEKKPYDYLETITFRKDDMMDFYKNGYNYNADIPSDVLDYIKTNLPPVSGFFFGSTEIDGGYFYDVIKTVLMFNRLKTKLDELAKNKEYADLYYSASW